MAIAVEAAATTGQPYFWGAPTFSQVRIGFDEAYSACGGYAEFYKGKMEVHFPGGGNIIYRSLDDPDNARGFTVAGAILDEVGDIKAAAWYEVLRPTLIDTDGWLWAIGTPKGRNWFWKEHQAAHGREDSACWQVPTLGVEIQGKQLIRRPHPYENPHIPFEEIENLFYTEPLDIFRQEILAEFIEHEGAVFRNIRPCLKAPETEPEKHAGHTIVAGVDWGKQQDFTAISVGCADCKQEIVRDRFNQIDYAFQRQRLISLYEEWGVDAVLVEINAMGEPIFEQLQREGIEVVAFQTTPSTKPQLIENLSLVFEREEWQFQDDPIWTAELEAYERKVSPTTGRSSYSAPEGGHDDTVIARALMVRQSEMAGPYVVVL